MFLVLGAVLLVIINGVYRETHTHTLSHTHSHLSPFPLAALAVVTVTAPGGTSSTELFSPNYPDGFPDDDLMEWRFAAQPKYSSNVTFLAASAPRCLKKEAGVGYQGSASWVLVLGLDDPQPTRIPGSFSLTLRNCEVDQKQPGLSLHLLVSTTRGSPPGEHHGQSRPQTSPCTSWCPPPGGAPQVSIMDRADPRHSGGLP